MLLSPALLMVFHNQPQHIYVCMGLRVCWEHGATVLCPSLQQGLACQGPAASAFST